MSEAVLTLRDVSLRAPAASRRNPRSVARDIGGALGLKLRREAGDERLLLDRVNLTVASGEVVIVIGGPDSGKNALLQVCAGFVRPDRGSVEVNGATAAFVHPGDGFHTALTGAENAVLRGVLDGLSRREAKRRAGAVLQFAELERLRDVPLARYSEESLVRLGFSAMVMSDARVLAWNDVVLCRHPLFRAKCLSHLPALLEDGRSIVIATDDLGKTELLGPRAVWLDRGTVAIDGSRGDVLARFLAPRVSPVPPDAPGEFSGASRLAAVQLLDDAGTPAASYLPGDPITVAVELELQAPTRLPYFLLSIAGQNGPITAASMFLDGQRPAVVDGRYRFECRFEGLVLAPGHLFTVRFAAYANDGTTLFPKRNIASFVMGGSAESCGFQHDKAETRIFGSPPVLSTYAWRFPGEVDETLGRGPD